MALFDAGLDRAIYGGDAHSNILAHLRLAEEPCQWDGDRAVVGIN